MTHTIITSVLSVSLTLLVCSASLNYYQFNQQTVYSCKDGYTPKERAEMDKLSRENPGMNIN